MNTIEQIFNFFDMRYVCDGKGFEIKLIGENKIGIYGIIMNKEGIDKLIEWQYSVFDTENCKRNIQTADGEILGVWPLETHFEVCSDYKFKVDIELIFDMVENKE